MNQRIKVPSLLALLLPALGLGCDTEPDRADRDAVFVLEVNGEVIDEGDISNAPAVQQGLLDLAAEQPPPCESGASFDLVLEIEGEEEVSVKGCGDPEAAFSPWCEICNYGPSDCFACCKCEGGTTYDCSVACEDCS